MTSVQIQRSIFALIVLSWWLFFFVVYPAKDRLRDGYSDKVFNAAITDKYIDYSDHAERKCTGRNGSKFYIPRSPESFIIFDKLQIGDSIVKEKGSMFAYVYRNDSLIFTFDYELSILK